ncbi:glycosyltransferase family 2 protein [Alkalihalobacillus sp. MEB130]|uniref:glycosyltransferase family 2 protein n=1 Tax=Alkalihalobacillus sp. MEB130 TaxID=2976704 RepID=UPI0028DFDC29|nr:glycosyltransferase family 2 protein [Alkalihalobacillus sp. MEB130]MDT8860329.1 glycosyltransferase family 2 protein [Alkalihalobacillus sp. MEB130]
MSSVSVQIVTFNSADDIQSCLEAVKNQVNPVQNIVIIDNHSKDQTVAKIKEWQSANRDFPLQLIENKQNTGFAPAHNQAMQLTETSFVVVLNPDVILDPHYIKTIITLLESDRGIGSATGKLYRDSSKKTLDSTGISIKLNRRAYDRGANEDDLGQWDGLTNVFGVSGAAAVYRRKMIDEISIDGEFYDEVFFAYKEDVDVAWRARLLGWEARFVPQAVATHKRGWKEEKKRSDVPLFIRHHSYINRYYTILKNDQWFFLILHLPFIIFYELVAFLYAIMSERELLKAWKAFSYQYQAMMLKRKKIQAKKKESSRTLYRLFKGIW